MQRRVLLSLACLPLAACSAVASDNAVQKFSFDDIGHHVDHIVAASPDATDAIWTPLDSTRSLAFGKPGEEPMLTLVCEMDEHTQPVIRIVRNTPADPGAKALLALLGARMNARVPADTRSAGSAWHWESRVPAQDPQLDVFLDGGSVEATVPGGGTLKLAASSEPGRVVNWCRRQSSQQASMEQPAPPA